MIGLPALESVARSPVRDAVELTESGLTGVDDPIPRRPFVPKLNITAPVDDEMTRGLRVEVPVIESIAFGVLDPIPTVPVGRIVKNGSPDDEATVSTGFDWLALAWIDRLENGDVEPRPRLPFAPSVNRLSPVDEAIENRLLLPAAPVIESAAEGVEDPIPRRPLEPKLNMSDPVEDAIANG